MTDNNFELAEHRLNISAYIMEVATTKKGRSFWQLVNLLYKHGMN